jgi:hypothetical protein
LSGQSVLPCIASLGLFSASEGIVKTVPHTSFSHFGNVLRQVLAPLVFESEDEVSESAEAAELKRELTVSVKIAFEDGGVVTRPGSLDVDLETSSRVAGNVGFDKVTPQAVLDTSTLWIVSSCSSEVIHAWKPETVNFVWTAMMAEDEGEAHGSALRPSRDPNLLLILRRHVAIPR